MTDPTMTIHIQQATMIADNKVRVYAAISDDDGLHDVRIVTITRAEHDRDIEGAVRRALEATPAAAAEEHLPDGRTSAEEDPTEHAVADHHDD